MIAAVKALGHDVTPIRAIIYQFVTLTRAGEKVKMSTRKATYVTLDELLEEVGRDAVRFFFLFRKHDSHLDFDLFREAEKAGLALDAGTADLTQLSAEEIELTKRAIGLAEVVASAVESLEPHRIPFYLLDLAGEFHRYYNKPANHIINVDDPKLSQARLFLAQVLRDTIAGGLELLGVSAPDRM